MRQLLKSTAIYGFGSVSQKILGFLFIPIYTSYFTVDEYGFLAILNVIFQLTLFIGLFGVSSASMRFYHETDDENYIKSVYGNAVLVLLILPSFLIIGLIPIVYWIIDNYFENINFYPLIFIIMITSIFSPIQKLLIGLMRIKQEAFKYICFNISHFIVQAIFILIMVIGLDKGLEGQVYARFFANILFFSISLFMLIKYCPPKPDIDMIKKLLSFGIPLIPFFIFTWLNESSGRFFIQKYLSLKDLGIFAFSIQISGLFILIQTALEKAITPHYYEIAGSEDGHKNIGKLITHILLILSFAFLLTSLIAKPLTILFIKNTAYYEGIQYIPLILIAFGLRSISKILHLGLMYTKKTKFLSSMKGVTVLIVFSLLVFLFKSTKLGINNVAISWIFGNIITIIWSYIVAQKYYRIKFEWDRIILLLFSTSVLFIGFTFPLVNNIFIDLFFKSALLVSTKFILLKMFRIDVLKPYN